MKLLFIVSLVALAAAKPANIFEEYGKRYPNKHLNDDEECEILGEQDSEIGPLNAIVDPARCWPGGVLHYMVEEGDFTADEVKLIEGGIDDLVASTMVDGQKCIDIVPWTSQTAYVRVWKGTGCSSSVGRTGSRQNLSLTTTCVNRHGTVMHEFLHAYGYRHEQSRTDRDEWITVNYDNIEEGKEHNFRKYDETEINLVGTPYDYGSVMHYSPYGFAIDKEIPTIITHDPDAMDIIGQRLALSDIDIERVQILYGCKDPAQTKYFKHLSNRDIQMCKS